MHQNMEGTFTLIFTKSVSDTTWDIMNSSAEQHNWTVGQTALRAAMLSIATKSSSCPSIQWNRAIQWTAGWTVISLIGHRWDGKIYFKLDVSRERLIMACKYIVFSWQFFSAHVLILGTSNSLFRLLKLIILWKYHKIYKNSSSKRKKNIWNIR